MSSFARASASCGPSLRPTKAGSRTSVLTVLMLSALAVSQTFPYIPTTVLVPALAGSSQNASDVAYIFRAGRSSVELLSLNISSTVDASSASLETISSSLPFLDGAPQTTAFTPMIADNGTIIVQEGDCQSSGYYGIWTYTPSNSTSGDAGSWNKGTATLASPEAFNAGPYFLGAAVSFSSTLAPTMSEPILYSYGGMCSTPSTNTSSWQSDGTYSNQMARLSPAQASPGIAYTLDLIATKGPAFPEAGFTFTAMTPSVSNRSGIVTQQASYVLLGGHTQQAFINMSTAAIWSLPEESWTFVSISTPDSRGSELAIKAISERADASIVDSRSGHTAVLSEDGSSLVVLGGWVGDVSQAANPQLAILSVGGSYEEWQWSIPQDQPDGSGLYGHGAALLPGNVMMVFGGYEVAASTTKMKRQSTSDSPQFFNLTSMTWSSSYTNPGFTANEAGGDSTSSGGTKSNDNKLKIGLGVGLGVGLAVIIGAILAYFCYRRYLKRKRSRDEAIRGLAQDTSQFLHGDDEMMERDDGPAFPWSDHAWYTGGHDPYDQGVRSLGYETLRGGRKTGGGGYPPNITRKPIPRAARGAYQPANNRPNNLPAMPGRIHPIYEADEDDHEPGSSLSPSPVNDGDRGTHTPTSNRYSDPFVTPTGVAAAVLFPPSRSSLTPSPEGRQRLDPEVQDWQSDVDAAESLLAQIPPRRTGRVSPTRRASMRSARSLADDERTASNVSESNRSAISITRSASGKSHFRLSGFTSIGATTLLASTNHTETRLGTSGSSSSSSNNTYCTAKTNFPALQAEGPSLLMTGNRGWINPEDDEEDFPMPGSPSKSKPRLSRGWLGSLRRVFSSGTSSSPSSSRAESPGRMSLDNVSSDYEPRLVGLNGIGGAALLRRKQGKHDWQPGDEKRDQEAEAAGEDDWDIEKAVEQRLVQVMFTVPRERLRVVNAEIEKEEEVVLVDPEKESQIYEEENLELAEDLEKAAYQEEYEKGKENEEAFEESFQADESPQTPEPPKRERAFPLIDRPHTPLERHPSMILHTAEAVRLERPKTRVLEMVESIESRSPGSSSGSPVQG